MFEDIFGRRLNEKGITLVDWDGHIANPAMKLIIKPPENAAFPVQAVLTSTEPRLYFNLPSRDPGTLRSDVGREGPRQTFQFGGGQTVWTSYVAIFPDRDAIDEDHLITVQFMDKAGKTASGDLMVRVIDQDRSDPLRFNVIVDFSLDQTRFFADERARNTVTQAANDWAFFIDDMALNEVPADAEIYWTFNPDFETGAYSKNSAPYRGFFLNVFGVRSDKYLKSGGAPSPGGLQASGGVELPLKRSGHVGIEAAGNFNKLGWILTPDDKEWWVADYRNNLPTDLYSIALHEIGHALIFNPDHPGFGRFAAHVTGGSVDGPQVVAYQGAPVYVHGSSHLVGGIDKASKKGAFGYGEAGTNAPGIIMPPRRWLITKLDLLVAQAAGYKIRQTSAFVPLAISTSSLANGTVSAPYRATLEAAGGVPLYYWVVESGELPAGLTLDSFSGTISGTPIRAGTLEFTVRVRDYHEGSAVIVAPLRITIGPR